MNSSICWNSVSGRCPGSVILILQPADPAPWERTGQYTQFYSKAVINILHRPASGMFFAPIVKTAFPHSATGGFKRFGQQRLLAAPDLSHSFNLF
jgi:hypothetical protein